MNKLCKYTSLIALTIVLFPTVACADTITTYASAQFIGPPSTDSQTATSGTITSEAYLPYDGSFLPNNSTATASDNGSLTTSAGPSYMVSDAGDHYDAISSWSNSYTNLTSTGQQYQLNFSLSGSLYSEFYVPGPRTSQSGYSIVIDVNGSPIWSSNATLRLMDIIGQAPNPPDTIVPNLTISGTSLNGTFTQDPNMAFTYNFDYSGLLSLGSIAPDQTLTIDYSIESLANGEEAVIASSALDMCGSVTVTATPEPATMFIYGLGLVVLAAYRIRFKKT
jgi:hypothetical protein